MTEKKMLARLEWAKKNQSTTLNFSYEHIINLPETVCQLTHLNTLNLKHNQIVSLPKSIDQLTELQSLLLTDNQLEELPASIGNLSNLQSLYLNDNHLDTIPESIANLTNLQSLYLNDNHLTSLPESIGKLTNLHSLFLSSNHLTSLPESIGNLTNLQSLYLIDNHLISLPRTIGKLSNLQSLYLSGNQLTCLPDTLGNLKNLQILFMDNNQFTHLPIELKKLKKLERINLKNNLLALPEAVCEISNAQYILENFIFAKDNAIYKYFDLPKDYIQAGLAILSYFITILEQKHKDIPCLVLIEKEQRKVTFTIKPPEGQKETINKTLIDYGLVISGKLNPEKIFQKQYHIMMLLQKLDMIKMEFFHYRNLLAENETTSGITNDKAFLNEEIFALFTMIGKVLSSDKNQPETDESLIIQHLDRDDLSIHRLITTLDKNIEKGLIPDIDSLKEQLEQLEEHSPNILYKLNCYFNNHFSDLGLKVSLSDITLALLSDTLDSLEL